MIRARRRAAAIVTAGALMAFQALAIIGAGPASAAVACNFNLATNTVGVTLDLDDFVFMSVEDPSGDIQYDDGTGPTDCGLANTTNTSQIVIAGASGDEYVLIDNWSGLPFPSTISWQIALGGDTADGIEIDLADDADGSVSVTNTGFTMNGGTGLFSGVEEVYVDGGDGNDTIDGSALTATGPSFEAYGQSGDDTITGGAGGDDLYGEDGDDTIDGGAGVDDVAGGAGDDWLAGGAGDDTIYGDEGDDTIDAGPGDDYAEGEEGADTFLEGSAANGSDELTGDSPASTGDVIDYSGRTTNTIVNMDSGSADSGEDANADGDATDTGDEGDELAGFEVAMTGSGNDTLVGDTTDETFAPGPGDDSVDGNGGSDTLDLSSATAAVTVDAAGGTAEGQGSDTFEEVEEFVGSAFDDTFIDDQSMDNGYDGGEGDDRFDQGAANGTDEDVITGGDGVDTVDYSQRTEDVDVYLNCWWRSGGSGEDDSICDDDVENALTGSGDDDVDGNASDNLIDTGDGDDEADGDLGRDTFMTGAGDDEADGDEGNDTFVDGTGNDYYEGDDGNDSVDFGSSTTGIQADLDNGTVTNGADDEVIWGIENLFGSAFDDTILGNWSNNTIRGRGGDDNITGAGGDDRLLGGAGSDLARGGNGDDDLYGRGGPDFLYGGGGTDLANGGAGMDVCKAEIKQKC